jgi:hypothetical protein
MRSKNGRHSDCGTLSNCAMNFLRDHQHDTARVDAYGTAVAVEVESVIALNHPLQAKHLPIAHARSDKFPS